MRNEKENITYHVLTKPCIKYDFLLKNNKNWSHNNGFKNRHVKVSVDSSKSGEIFICVFGLPLQSTYTVLNLKELYEQSYLFKCWCECESKLTVFQFLSLISSGWMRKFWHCVMFCFSKTPFERCRRALFQCIFPSVLIEYE